MIRIVFVLGGIPGQYYSGVLDEEAPRGATFALTTTMLSWG